MSKKIFSVLGVPGGTTTTVTTDAVVRIPAADLNEFSEFLAVEISVSGNPIRYAFNVDPVQGAMGAGTGHIMPVGGSLRLANRRAAQQIRMINQVAGTQSEINWTCEFETSQ